MMKFNHYQKKKKKKKINELKFICQSIYFFLPTGKNIERKDIFFLPENFRIALSVALKFERTLTNQFKCVPIYVILAVVHLHLIYMYKS